MKKIQKIALVVAALFSAHTANAGSYQLNEYSITGLGRSFAGAGVVGDDYSAIAFNPAGMTSVQADIDGTGPNAGQKAKMDHYVNVPHGFVQYNPNEDFSLGFGIYVPYGLSTRYKADSFIATTAVKSELQVVDFAPAVAYKLTDTLSIGGSFIARYIYGNMTNVISSAAGGGTSDFELDGWTVSGSLGLVYEPIKDTRFGFSWRLKSAQQVKGDHKIKGNLAYGGMFNGTYIGRASPDLPETFTFSAFTKQGSFGLSGTARWTHWSRSFEEFVMTSENPMFAAAGGVAKGSPYRYANSWTLTAGVDYYYNENWTFRVGGGWDESPDHNYNTRTWRIPDNDRIWASCGFSYIQPKWQIDVGYAHMFGKTAQIDEPNEMGAVDGKLKNLRSNLFGAQVQYRF